jgi:hypothetical protein
MLDFQQSPVYRDACELLRLIGQITDCLDGVDVSVAEALRRAGCDLVLNLADAGAPADDVVARGWRDRVRGAAFRCAAMLDVCRSVGAIHAKRHAESARLVERIVAGLDPSPPPP